MKKNLLHGIIGKVISSILTLALIFTIVPEQAIAKNLSKVDIKTQLMQAMKEEQSKYSANAYVNSKYGKPLDENKTSKDSDENKLVRVIVQFEQEPAIKKVNTENSKSLKSTAATKKVEESVKSGQEDIADKVEEVTGTKIIRSFGYLINGISIEVKKSKIQKLKAIKGVKAVTEVQTFTPSMESAKELTEAYNVWKDYGYKGEGMVVSVIDTGIDYTHKDLKNINTAKIKLTKDKVNETIKTLSHGKYFTDKVPYGYNYADHNTQIVDNGEMHGMHVAGIIGANGDEAEASAGNAIRGVAPEAQLLAMKVFSNNSELQGCYADDVIAAIEDSVKLGADIINMSLGSVSGYADSADPQQLAIKNATDAGVLCVVSAGNSQTSTTTNGWNQPLNTFKLKDTSTLGNPAVWDDSFSVASSENSTLLFDGCTITSGKGNIINTGYKAASSVFSLGELANEHEVVYCGLGKEEDFKKHEFGYLNGKIALIERGEITFSEKVLNSFWGGPDGIIIFNHETGGNIPIDMSVDTYLAAPNVLSIGYSDGMSILNSINNGDNTFKLEATGKKVHIQNSDSGDMSQYSSWGPTEDLEFKPEITAPGGDIFSLANNNKYQTMSGTSMAAPHVSGAEALILQGIKDKNLALKDKVVFAKDTAMNTSKIYIDKFNNKVPISPRRQGAGLIQIEEAIKNNVIATDNKGKAAAALKEIGQVTSFDINLKNYSNKDLSFNLENGGILTEETDENSLIKELSIKDAAMTSNNNTVTVKANSTERVTVTVKLPEGFTKNNFVEGYVKLNSTDGSNPNLVMPFMGFYGDWSQEAIIDKPMYSKDSLTKVTSAVSFSSDGSGYYLGFTGADEKKNPLVNADNIAISPNGDDFYDNVVGILYLLRGAKSLKAEIVDKKTNSVIRKVYTNTSVPKNTLESLLGGKGGSQTYLTNGEWDGKVYNSSTGKFEAAPQGEYIYRITASVNGDSSKEQVLDIPVKLDITAPTVKIDNVVKHTDSEGNSTYELQWEAKDDFSGISDVKFIYSVNGTNNLINKENVKCENGIYKANINFTEGMKNEVSIAVMDNAGNIASDTKKIAADELKGIKLFNLEDGKVYNETSLKDGKFVINGTAGNDIKRITINDEDVPVNDNVISYPEDITDGDYSFKVCAYDAADKEVYNETYKIKFDLKAPEITITSPFAENGGMYTTDTDGVTIKGTIKEDNLSEFYVEYDSPEVDEDGNFSCYVEGLTDGLNKISVTAYDTSGHRTTKYINIMYNSDDHPLKVNFSNLQSITTVSKENAVNDVYTIKGTLNHFPKCFKINDADVKINSDLTFSTDVKLNQGVNKVSVYAEDDDAYNNEVVYDWGYRLLYDTMAPKLTLEEPIAKGDGKVYTNKDSILIRGEVTDNFFGYVLSINGDQVLNVGDEPVADEKVLSRSFEKSIALKNGENKVIINAVDKLGNRTDITVPVVVDKVAPKVTVSGVEEGKLYNTSITPKVTANEDSTITMTLNGKAYDGSAITAEGKYELAAYAVDLAGNVSTLAAVNFSIDKTAPEISVTGVEDGKSYNSNVLPVVKTNEVSKVSMTLNGKPYDNSAITEEGSYVLVVNAVDTALNASTKTISFSIDKTAPVITITGVTEGAKYDGSLNAPTFSAGSDKVTVTLDGTTYDGKTVTNSGYHVFIVTATDLAGNVSTKTIDFSINAMLTADDTKTFEAIINSSSRKVDVILNGTTTISAAVLTSLAGADKQVSFVVNAPEGSVSPTVTWTFNTKDFDKSKIKDIDLSLNATSPVASAIAKTDKNAQILSFKYHGELPAPAQIMVKADSKLVVSGRIFLYYYNIDTKKAELVKGTNADGSFNVDADGYVTLTITHCSDYFLSSVAPVSPKSGSLPKTGNVIDTNILLAFGAIFIACGAAFVWRRRA